MSVTSRHTRNAGAGGAEQRRPASAWQTQAELQSAQGGALKLRVLVAVVMLAGGSMTAEAAYDPRPGRWCGWWMRHEKGVADKSYNLARKWREYGRNAGGPGVGVIVVWWHHVGVIVGQTATGWLVKSGNDGHAVRTRERSLRGVIAYRH